MTPAGDPRAPGRPGDRDRDATGRPRNSRPRDGLGRPLDRAATGEPTTPDELRLAPGEALALAQDLMDAGRPFHAHEVLELAWKSAPASERGLWKGLAQLAVGLTHARRGNGLGAVALLRRGAAALDEASGVGLASASARSRDSSTEPHGTGAGRQGTGVRPKGTSVGPHGIDVAAVRRAANELADRIERTGLAPVGQADLRLSLTHG